MLIIFAHVDYYRQTPPKVPNFFKTLFRRKIVLWFLGSEILRDYWLSGVSVSRVFLFYLNLEFVCSPMVVTGASCGPSRFRNGRFCSSLSLSSSVFGQSCLAS